MAPRRGAALPVPSQSSSLQQLLSFARLVLQQTSRGLDPVLSVSELFAASDAATVLAKEISDDDPLSEAEFTALWSQPGQDAAAYLALLSLALRRSRNSLDKGRAFFYADILTRLSYQLSTLCFVPNRVLREHICCDVLAPALLGVDALECYSRLLADIAEQLKPAAAAALPGRADGRSTADIAQGGAAAGGRPGRQQRTQQRTRQPHSSSLASHPTVSEALQLVENTTSSVAFLIDAVNQRGSGSSSSGGGGGSGAWAATQHDRQVHQLRTRLHSSAVVDNLAQVLLLSTAVASSRNERLNAAAALARSANWLCKVKHAVDFRFTLFLRRPCGCALAAAHIAQLCAALDGGDAFGAAKPEVLVMPGCPITKDTYLVRMDRTARQYDEVAMRLTRAANLHAAIVTVGAWTRLQRTSRALQEPPCKAAGTRGDGACSAEAVSAGQGWAGASQRAVPVGQEGGGGGDPDAKLGPEEERTVVDPCLHKLPPFNRTATVHLCLRLAKGVLACWGRPLPGLRLELPNKNSSAPALLLPKEHGCALLHQALVCSRLALLPAVWGQERVPRSTRAQLRAWWETYVAAAQHPEALAVGEPVKVLDYPEWMWQQGGLGAAPSADATAAIEAGLLPCLARLVARMGAGDSEGTVWRPPNIFPGVGPCLADVLQFGPLGQVGQLVSALGRRLRGAAEELAPAAAAALEGGGAKKGTGETASWLGNVVRQATLYAETCLDALLLRWLDAHAGAAAAGRAAPGTECVTQRPAAGAAATAAQCPLRSSFALAELLPAVSVGVRLCGEIANLAGGEGGGGECGGGGAGDTAAGRRYECYSLGLIELLDGWCRAADYALDCAIVLLAMLCQEAAAEPLGSRDDGVGCGASSGAACSTGDSGCPSGAGDRAHSAAWRQLLLRDVRLMELLGAGMALHKELSRVAAAGLLPPNMNHRAVHRFLSTRLSGALPLAALTFPAEFRAAAEGGAGPAAGAEQGFGAGAEAAEGGRGAAPSPHPCMSLAAVQAVLEWRAAHGVNGPGQKGDEGLKAVVRVLGGWDPPPGEAWDLARGCCVMYGLDLAEVVEVVRGMPRPEEARAAVAAAAASAAGAPASGPA